MKKTTHILFLSLMPLYAQGLFFFPSSEEPVDDPYQAVAPLLVSNEQKLIRSWLSYNAYHLNDLGDPVGTMYSGGTPLFDEQTGMYLSAYSYLTQRHPEKPWLTLQKAQELVMPLMQKISSAERNALIQALPMLKKTSNFTHAINQLPQELHQYLTNHQHSKDIHSMLMKYFDEKTGQLSLEGKGFYENIVSILQRPDKPSGIS